MCIGIYKPKDVKLPSKETLQICFQNNDDGAGFMFYRQDKIIIRKGFLSFKTFWKAFQSYSFTEKDIIGIHFRIGTSGNKRGACQTHPFSVTSEISKLKATCIETQRSLLHNGIIGKGYKDLSDTMLKILDISTKRKGKQFKILKKLSKNNRFLLFDIHHEPEMLGNWIQDSGVYYSNTSYQEDYFYLGYPNYYSNFSDYYYTDNFSYDENYCYEKKVYPCPVCGETFNITDSPFAFYTNKCLVCDSIYSDEGMLLEFGTKEKTCSYCEKPITEGIMFGEDILCQRCADLLNIKGDLPF